MRIAYLTWQRVDRRDGVVEKIASQLRHWRGKNHDVRLFGLSQSRTIWPGARDISHRLVDCGTLMQRNGRARTLARSVMDWRPDLIFFRMAAYYPALGDLMNRIPTVVDLNTNDLIEMRRELSPWLYLYYRHFRRHILKRAAGITAVTSELAATVEGEVPKMVITNGIEFARYPVLPASNEDCPRLFFLGSAGRRWHGVGKILQLADHRPDWSFDIVGPSFSDLGRLPPNVTCHGLLSPDEYLKIMSRAHVAIASLAMHENCLRQACPLKVRHYLAHGLPVIIGYEEADFDENASFLLRLPNSPNNVVSQLNQIDRFVNGWMNRRVPRSEIEHLDLDRKESARLSFFEEINRAASCSAGNQQSGF